MLSHNQLKEGQQVIFFTLKMIDLFNIPLSGFIALWCRHESFQMHPSNNLLLAYAILIAMVLYPINGLYQVWRGSSERDEIKVICSSWTLLFIALLGVCFLFKDLRIISRLMMFYWYIMGLILWISWRMVLRYILRKIRKTGLNLKNIIIIGTGNIAEKTAYTLKHAKWTGLHVTAFYNINHESIQNLIHDVEHKKIDQVWIALCSSESEKTQKIIAALDTTTVDIRLVPDIFQMRLINQSVSMIDNLPVINLCMTPMTGINRLFKSIEDKVIASIILTSISPIMLALAVLVKITSKGPIFFRQERVGWNGRPFTILKFRSMPVERETNNAVWGNATQKPKTSIGSFMRRYSLDELPQFINVLKGDMSIVGPRPERTQFVSQFKHDIPCYMKKHKVKAGITGWAQINGWRGDTDLNKRIEFDLYYIDNWSFWFDIKIIFLTLTHGILNKNAN